MTQRILQIIPLDVIDYNKTEGYQEYLQKRVSEEDLDRLILLQYNPVITAGRKFKGPEDSKIDSDLRVPREFLEKKDINIISIDRGGGIVYHYPGQIVGYPIIKLEKSLRYYVIDLEEVLIRTLNDFGVKTVRIKNMEETYDTTEERDTKAQRYIGVWYKKDNKWFKIGSVGVHTNEIDGTKITKHGFCININKSCYDLINPCGIEDANYISLSEIVEKTIDLEEVKRVIDRNFRKVFGYQKEVIKSHVSN